MKRLITLSLLLTISASVSSSQAQEVTTHLQATAYQTADGNSAQTQPPLADEVREPKSNVLDLLTQYQQRPLISGRVRAQLDTQLLKLSGL
jgi:hypothetical protein